MNEESSGAAREASLRLQVGGTLVPGRDIYIARPEDAQLFELLSEGEYVNILSSRQVGKSSLMLHTAFRLKAERGARFAVVDLTSLGTPDNARSYFRGLVGAIAKQLQLTFDQQAYWRESADTETNTQQFIRFFREAVAGQIDSPIVICLDEIDSTLKLPFTDDLFTALRAMYNERAIVSEYQRIALCLVGVATPDELIKDRRTTPYNVGKTLWLGDFDPARDDLTPIERVLSDDPKLGSELLGRVLQWTGGHPFLTNKLCQDLRTAGVAVPEDVDRFVDKRYATLEGLGEDVHIQQILRFLRERLTDGYASFDLYERIRKGGKERDQPSLAHAELKLSGLVKRDGTGMLVLRNRIYERLFDVEWVRKTRPKQEAKRYRRAAFATAAVLVLAVVGAATYFQAVVVPSEAQLAASEAQLTARRALESSRVTLSDDPRGRTAVGLPAQDTLAVLRRVLPHLVTLGNAPDGRGLSLDLTSTGLTDGDLNGIAQVTGLRALGISDNPAVTTLAPLRALVNLESLDVAGTNVSNLSPLARLTDLQQLDVSSTPVRSVAPLSGLTRLKELNLSRTDVKDLSPLYGLASLRTLALDGLGDIPFNPGNIPNLKVLRDPAPRKAGTGFKPGESFRDCAECPQMVVVPAGSFEMGSPARDEGHEKDEEPQHRVRIAQPFAVSKYEVRFDEWSFCMQDGVCRVVSDPVWGRGPRPVIVVSWDDAQAYVQWLSKKTGQPYRLLSEAEWEYAARAGTTTRYPWGDEPGTNRANFYGSGSEWSGEQTAPVGSFEPNAFGLHDMIGNVWEWVEDCWHGSYQGAPADGSAWATGDCGRRVVRGGSWYSRPVIARVAVRSRSVPSDRDVSQGFRLARTLTP